MATLSTRATVNIEVDEIKRLMYAVFSDYYTESNPNGIFMMGIAENTLTHDLITDHINQHFSINSHMLHYENPSGSDELRNALSAFMNRNFAPHKPLAREHITIMNGITSVLDTFCFCAAEAGDGVLVAQPFYVGFLDDFRARAGVLPVPVPMRGDDVTGMASVARHEEALIKAEKEGIKIKALLFCNPQNPLGRAYSKEVIEAYLYLCAKYNIHFISDEIYALGCFPNEDIPDPEPFVSVLSLDVKNFIDPSLVHVLYGMSKDFCSNGLRIGAFVSQYNPLMHRAMGEIARFAYASSMSDRAWCLILQDEVFLEKYFAEMRKRMRSAYEVATGALKELNIPYSQASYGSFIWLDLSSFLPEKTIDEERRLAWKMLKNGVWIATGEAFQSEEPGWFRLTFAMPEKELKFGLDRLKKALTTE